MLETRTVGERLTLGPAPVAVAAHVEATASARLVEVANRIGAGSMARPACTCGGMGGHLAVSWCLDSGSPQIRVTLSTLSVASSRIEYMFEQGAISMLQRLGRWAGELASVELPTDDVAMIDELRALEELKCAVEARQTELAIAFDAAQRRRQSERRVPAARQGRGVAEQIALSRRVSRH